jgi:sugar lactone lactonase YvrE
MSTSRIVRSRLALAPRSATLLILILAGAPAMGAEPGPHFLLQWGSKGKEAGAFDFPIGVVVCRDGTICITDFYNARVQRFTPDGKFLSAFAVLPNPGGLALDRDENLYITHFSAMKLKEPRKPDRVSVYTREGVRLREWGKTGKGDGEFDYPGGIAVGPDGRVYVADQTNRRVQVFDTHGKFLGKWGEYGTKEGQFGGNVSPKSRVGGPQFVALDSDGNVFTTEGSVCRVQKFTRDGKFLLAWQDDADKPGGFGGGFLGGKLQGPTGICIDATGRVWVGAVSGRIQRFSADGAYLGLLSDDQSGPLIAPHGLAADGSESLYVVDSYNHRILKFAIGR